MIDFYECFNIYDLGWQNVTKPTIFYKLVKTYKNQYFNRNMLADMWQIMQQFDDKCRIFRHCAIEIPGTIFHQSHMAGDTFSGR